MNGGAVAFIVLSAIALVTLAIVLPIVLLKPTTTTKPRVVTWTPLSWTAPQRTDFTSLWGTQGYDEQLAPCVIDILQLIYTYAQATDYMKVDISTVGDITNEYCQFVSTLFGAVSQCAKGIDVKSKPFDVIAPIVKTLCETDADLCTTCSNADIQLACIVNEAIKDWTVIKAFYTFDADKTKANAEECMSKLMGKCNLCR